MVGLKAVQDFSILEKMADAAKDAGCQGAYMEPEKLKQKFAMSTWMSAISSGTVTGRTSVVGLQSVHRIERQVDPETQSRDILQRQKHPDAGWQVVSGVGGNAAAPNFCPWFQRHRVDEHSFPPGSLLASGCRRVCRPAYLLWQWKPARGLLLQGTEECSNLKADLRG
uniref:Uncharacterized protein n=1 Tax=Chromera velia CCMP2878 TaxID=1169474 RepID=A0A0K6S915_9ALVE|eukprot:Cvel_6954.t2-p1 / transcript=Cvel_6954.t2 / gene=Cvel_6954 / organism=Chromera_velia_CCMP2878 / gene_product=Alpha-protein kinase 1, putative / transcript_product=Alpha-protein kinase 1, putative / location=Cvel_scaffold352:82717-83217(-) / protein_length=167 / sequence_SO=supercontig / SO=protein_coding / is_pseudo=false